MRVARALILIVLAAATTSCGYTLAGRGSFLPSSIKAIGIPLFTNTTSVYQVEQVLTEKVRTEFIGRGKYKVLPQDTGVDALLKGEITSINVAPGALNREQQASRYTITLTAKIEFTETATGKVIWQNPGLVVNEEYDVTNATSAIDPSAFFGQQADALNRVATDFARSVVSAILEAF